jgi:PRTRC genetic system protein B
MEIGIEMGGLRQYTLRQAILLYDDGFPNGSSGAYASVHDVRASSSRPVLGPGVPIRRGFITSLLRSLGHSLEAEYLPDYVLYRTAEMVVWWTPPAVRTLFFREGSALGPLDAEDLPVPGLVWRVDSRFGDQLRLRAVAGDARPGPDAPLYVAPMWNTSPGDGNVCQGTMQRPDADGLDALPRWVDGYFRAQFTHAYGGGPLTAKDDVVAMWQAMKGRRTFDDSYLLAATNHQRRVPETLTTFAAGGIHHG